MGYDETNFLVHFNYDRGGKIVLVTIQNIMTDLDDINAKRQEIYSKYRKKSIFLSGDGLTKAIKWEKWKIFTEKDVKAQIIQLYTISEKEKLRVPKMYYKISGKENPLQLDN